MSLGRLLTFAQTELLTWVMWAFGHPVRALGQSMVAGTFIRVQEAGLGQGVGQLAPDPWVQVHVDPRDEWE